MPIPASISDLSTTPGSNSPSGSDSPSVLDDHQRTAYAFIKTLSDAKAAIADTVLLTGNQTIAGTKTFSSPIAGSISGNAATATTAGNVTGTVAIANGGTGQTTGASAVAALFGTRVDVASAATVDLTSVVSSINITGTTTITAFTVAVGRLIFARFNAALTLTNNANIVTQSGANIITAAGDTCILRATAANVVEVLAYTRGIPQALGDGQTWQNVTGSRASATTYTNSTGRPIVVAVTSGVSTSSSVISSVAGSEVVRSNLSVGGGSFQANTTVVVPAGATYAATVSPSISNWWELR